MVIPVFGTGFSRVTHPFATRCRCKHRHPVRLACVKPAASVRPEPGSNSPSTSLVRFGEPPRTVDRVPRPHIPWRARRGEPDMSANPHPTIRNCMGRPRRTRTSDEATRTGIRLLFRFQGAHRPPVARARTRTAALLGGAPPPRLAVPPARSLTGRRFRVRGGAVTLVVVGQNINHRPRFASVPGRCRSQGAAPT